MGMQTSHSPGSAVVPVAVGFSSASVNSAREKNKRAVTAPTPTNSASRDFGDEEMGAPSPDDARPGSAGSSNPPLNPPENGASPDPRDDWSETASRDSGDDELGTVSADNASSPGNAGSPNLPLNPPENSTSPDPSDDETGWREIV